MLAAVNAVAALQLDPVKGPPAVPGADAVAPGIVASSFTTIPSVGVTPLPGLPIRSAAVRRTRAFGVTRQEQHSDSCSSAVNTYTLAQILPVVPDNGPKASAPSDPSL